MSFPASLQNCAAEYPPFMMMNFLEAERQKAKPETRVRFKASNIPICSVIFQLSYHLET